MMTASGHLPQYISSFGPKAYRIRPLGYFVVLSILFTALAVCSYYSIFCRHHSLMNTTRLQSDEQSTAESTTTTSTIISSIHHSSFINRLSVNSNKTEPDSAPSEQEEQLVYCDTFNTNSEKPVCGKKFSTTWISHLERFNMSAGQINDMTNVDDIRILRKDPVHVTAFDDSHFGDAMDSVLKSFHTVFPMKKIIVYDLGLSEGNIERLNDLSYVLEVRPFNYSAYPDYVRNLYEYRWKPLLLAEVLSEFEAVFYSDAHIVWQKYWHVESMLEKVHCQPDGCPSHYYHSFVVGSSDHSIYATTDKSVYDYFPLDDGYARQIECAQGGFQLSFYTRDVCAHIHKWNVLCALEKNCIASAGSTLMCNFGNTRWTRFAGCHRYDQSVVNILLANRNSYDVSKYILPFTESRG